MECLTITKRGYFPEKKKKKKERRGDLAKLYLPVTRKRFLDLVRSSLLLIYVNEEGSNGAFLLINYWKGPLQITVVVYDLSPFHATQQKFKKRKNLISYGSCSLSFLFHFSPLQRTAPNSIPCHRSDFSPSLTSASATPGHSNSTCEVWQIRWL
jgi:hypothetical protein